MQPEVIQAPDGTEVLHSKESRQKVRRWSYEADVTIRMPDTKDDDGDTIVGQVLPKRTIKLDSVSFTTTKGAKLDRVSQQEYLRQSSPMFQRSDVHVRAIPHETVSYVTLRQLNGYRDMAMILDRALEIALREASEVANSRSTGSQFVEVPESEGITPVTFATIKERFYEKARTELHGSDSNNIEQSFASDDPAASEQAEAANDTSDLVPGAAG